MMKRRSFLKLIGAVVLAPSLPIPAKPTLEAGEFMYRGYKFHECRNRNPNHPCTILLYVRVDIKGEAYANSYLIDKEDYKHRDVYCDHMIISINRLKRRLGAT